MRLNLFTTLCALLATTQLAIAADPPAPVVSVKPFSNRQKAAQGMLTLATVCAIGAAVCTTKGTAMQVAGFGAGALCCTYASGTAGIFDDEQWDASVKKYGDKAKATCGKIKDGVFVCGEWVVEMVGGVWQVVRRAATAERHFVPRKRARLPRSIDGLRTRGGRKMRRSSRGREARDRMPLRL